MIIYVNINKETGQISVNNDRYPDTEIIVLNSGTLKNTENSMQFELAFNTSIFENIQPHPMDNTNANTN
jgi:hypothetical protein